MCSHLLYSKVTVKLRTSCIISFETSSGKVHTNFTQNTSVVTRTKISTYLAPALRSSPARGSVLHPHTFRGRGREGRMDLARFVWAQRLISKAAECYETFPILELTHVTGSTLQTGPHKSVTGSHMCNTCFMGHICLIDSEVRGSEDWLYSIQPTRRDCIPPGVVALP